jgi:hypothetical protein
MTTPLRKPPAVLPGQPPAEVPAEPGGPLEASTEAKRLAAAILEALAGVRGAAEVARLLGISLARYYQLEARALAGLLAACEPRRRGGRHRPANELAALRQECERLRKECARQQALVRAARRTVGLAPPPPAPAPPEGPARRRRKRRPKARALKMATLLRESSAAQPAGERDAPAVEEAPAPADGGA